jgi:hypothetical protein
VANTHSRPATVTLQEQEALNALTDHADHADRRHALLHRGVREPGGLGRVEVTQHALRVRDHANFSMRNNKDGSQPRVSRSDITASKQQDWWGVYSINVTPDQIFQN